MEFDHFRRVWGKQLLGYVRRYSAKIGASGEQRADLEQTAWLAAFVALKGWNPTGGRNPWHWVAPSVRTQMWRAWRKMNGQRGQGATWVKPSRFVEFESSAQTDESHRHLVEILDMRRAFAEHPRPQALVRFVMLALSPASGADLGRAVGLERRAISRQRQAVRRELAGALG